MWEGPLFRASQRMPGGNFVLRKGAMAYDTLLKRQKAAAEAVGLNPELMGTHSMRSGGATAAANSRVPDRLWKKHGRWKSEWVKDHYAREKLKERLRPSQAVWEDLTADGDVLW